LGQLAVVPRDSVQRALEDFALHVAREGDEASTETADTHENVLVVLGVFHGAFQVAAAHDGNHCLRAAEVEVCIQKGLQLGTPIGEELGAELHVLYGAGVNRGRRFDDGVEHGGDTRPVIPAGGCVAVVHGGAGASAVGRGSGPAPHQGVGAVVDDDH